MDWSGLDCGLNICMRAMQLQNYFDVSAKGVALQYILYSDLRPWSR